MIDWNWKLCSMASEDWKGAATVPAYKDKGDMINV